VSDALDFAFGWVEGAINGITGGLAFLSSIVGTVWGWVVNAAAIVGSWIWQAVDGFWNVVIVPAFHAVEAAAQWSFDTLLGLVNDVRNAAAWVWDNLLMPMWSWIVHAAETVGGWIWAAIQAFYHDVILPLWNLLVEAARLVAEIWDWIVRVAEFAVRLVIKAADWLIWFGEHTISDLLALLRDPGALFTRDFLLGAADSAHGYMDRIAQDWEHMLA
jgi:hypothetical protein